eukprot:TRINITY_DN3394_c0_g2_i1.p1 TRINITY_DN3394_c0_g2~~TRINITY_DN3394_c0_g2_i1.p1  ORF type:complete len:425 (-),score=96.11 TRINITY_DN3394_c0_g2_i1:186-1460(-)
MSSVLQLLLSRPPLAWLDITVEEARGLAKGGAFSKTNTYCVIQCGGDVHSTACKKNTTTPSWKEKITFRVTDLSHHALLKIYLYNKGMREDSLIGLVEVRLQKLFDQQPKEEWLPLFPSANNLNTKHKQVGEVRVSMQLVLTSQAKEVKLKKKPVFILEAMVKSLTANGELAAKDSGQGVEESNSNSSNATPSSPDSPKVDRSSADVSDPSSSPSELVLLNNLGGITCLSIPTRMNTCDILLFSSKHALSYATKLLTHSKWDHVGLVINFRGVLTLLESTYGSGVQINHLDDRLKNFIEKGTRVGVRRLQTPLTADQKETLVYFIHDMLGRPYEKNLLELVRAVGVSGKENPGSSKKEDLSSVFCSELVAAALQKIGLLSTAWPANEYAPADFASSAIDNRLMKCVYSPVQVFGRRIPFENGSR